MKVGIYTPYLDTAGGGEKYMLTIAECLAADNQVDIFLDKNLRMIGKNKILTKIKKLHDFNLEKIQFVDAPVGNGSSVVARYLFLKKYDVFFCLTDGSIFYANAKKNILHIQTPIINPALKEVKNKVKLSSWDLVMYNSHFTQKHVQGYEEIPGQVIYPPVNTEEIKPLVKKKQILTVGRFFSYLKVKKHEVLIKLFINLYKENKIKGWSLHLAGGASEGDIEYLESLKKLAGDYPIFIHPNIEYQDILKLYGESSIYWHAMGYEEDDPTKMEHFGITTVEAMAGGCVPVVINKGGQTEIVQEGVSGYLWNTVSELNKYTMDLIEDQKKREELSKNAIQQSKTFSKEKFIEEIKKICYDKN